MNIVSATYKGSYFHPDEAKNKSIPEFAFIGRSNVGKSSLINYLLQKNLAKTSATPGKTSMLNYFLVNNAFYFVDLPGYGYAKRSHVERIKIGEIIFTYLKKSGQLRCLFILMDSRHPFTDIDEDFIIETVKNQIPVALIFTKTDKLNQSELHSLKNKSIDSKLNTLFETPPNVFFTSVVKKRGRRELMEFIDYVLHL